MAHEAATVNGTWRFPPRGCVDCRFFTTGVLCRSLVLAWRSRTKPAKDTLCFLCPGDGLMMETRRLLPGHSLCLPVTSLRGGFGDSLAM